MSPQRNSISRLWKRFASSPATSTGIYSGRSRHTGTPPTEPTGSASRAIENGGYRLPERRPPVHTGGRQLSAHGERLFGSVDLRAIGIRVLCQAQNFSEIGPRLLLVSRCLSGFGGTIEPAQALAGILHRSFVGFERLTGLPLVHQQIAQQLTHRIQAVLHRYVLLASILEVGGSAHELERLLRLALSLSQPGLGAQSLDLDLPGPVALICLLQIGT